MNAQSRSLTSAVLMVLAVACFAGAVTFGLAIPLLAVSYWSITYGVIFLVAGVAALFVRHRERRGSPPEERP